MALGRHGALTLGGRGVPPAPAVLWAVGLAAAVATAGTVLLASATPELYQRELRVVLLAWTSLPFIGAGMIAWRHRPDSRFGPLLIVAGLVTPISTLQWADPPLLNTVGQLCDLLLPALWLHVFLAYPTGRVTGRVRRLLVAAGYAAALVLQVAILAFGGFDGRNLLSLTARPEVAEVLQNVQLLSLSALSLVAVAALWLRRRSGPAPRRAVALLVDSFGAALIMVAALLTAGALQLPAFEVIRLITFGVVGLAPLAFLLGLLDARLARSGVAEMVVRLNDGPPADLRDLIARALRDDSLTVAYWLPGRGGWADGHGDPVTLPATGDPRRTVTVLEQRGEPLAALMYDPSLAEEPELVAAVGAAAAIALENARLQAELLARLQDLHGSRARLVEAAQDERRRLERDLHDGAQQRLVALALELGLLQGELADPEARRRIEHARREVTVSMEELRGIARGIHPAVVSSHGLAVALESVAARTSMPLRLRVEDLPRLPENIEVAAYYVVCESLANTGKHALATSASIDVRVSGGALVVVVTDNGVGGADTGRGTGLRGLSDRVEALDGRLRVWSPSGGGTRVRAEIPVPAG
ncbi:MAG TPA: histidine kinase [Mycobacteriales bacterium]|nr:histidine kinase [Mycobacteriales bacterium]